MKKINLVIVLMMLVLVNLYSMPQDDKELNRKLLDAVWKGEYENVKFFLKIGADVNAVDEGGYTALQMVATNEDLEIGLLLIEAGGDLNQMNRKDPTTALHRAIKHGYVKMVELFIKHGVDLNQALTEHNWTPLHMAAYYGYPKIAKLLIGAGADLNQMTNNGLTALAVASFPQHHEIRPDWIEEVSRQGGNLHDEVRRLLLEAGAQMEPSFSFYLNDLMASYSSGIWILGANGILVFYYFMMYADYIPMLEMKDVLMP